MQVDYDKLHRLDGKVALVTGAGGGLGQEICAALIACGARVLLTDRDATAGLKAAAALPGSAFFTHDVTDEAQWQAAVAEAIKQFGGLDILVNNTGVESAEFIGDTTVENFRRDMDINVTGVFLGMKHAVLAMRPCGAAGEGGAIVNLSSISGLVGVPGQVAYCASKGAVRLMSKSTAIESGRRGYGIRVNSVHPAIIPTTMGNKVISDFARLGFAADEAAASEMLGALHPMGYGRPSDVASAVCFLASEGARWINGAELALDGGASAS